MSAALPPGIWIASSAKRSVQQTFLNLANALNRPCFRRSDDLLSGVTEPVSVEKDILRIAIAESPASVRSELLYL